MSRFATDRRRAIGGCAATCSATRSTASSPSCSASSRRASSGGWLRFVFVTGRWEIVRGQPPAAHVRALPRRRTSSRLSVRRRRGRAGAAGWSPVSSTPARSRPARAPCDAAVAGAPARRPGRALLAARARGRLLVLLDDADARARPSTVAAAVVAAVARPARRRRRLPAPAAPRWSWSAAVADARSCSSAYLADAVGWDDWGGFMLNVFLAVCVDHPVLPARRAARPRPALDAAADARDVHRATSSSSAARRCSCCC